jgi:tryptophan halogenase
MEHLRLDADSDSIRKIEMRIGRRAETWVNNCLAVGLSGGFLEPLESTGIHFIELALRVFVDHLSLGPAHEPVRRHYNRLMAGVFDEVADFLVMHYNLNRRHGDPFWDHCREQLPLPPSLVEKLRLWSVKAPSITDLSSSINVFTGFSYSTILSGLGAINGIAGNLAPFVDLKKSAVALDKIRHDRSIAVQASPPHEDIVQKLRGAAG